MPRPLLTPARTSCAPPRGRWCAALAFSLALALAALSAAWPALASEEAAAPVKGAAAGKAPTAAAAAAAAAINPAPAPAPAAETAASADPLERLRERLAERLAATKASGSTGSLKVMNLPAPAGRSPAAPSSTSSASPPVPSAAARSSTPVKAAAHTTSRGKPGTSRAPHGPAHWSYSGVVGPQAWGGLRPEFSMCGNGQRQSPIDIREGIAVDLEPVQFNYQASAFTVVDNGHTVQVNLAQGNFIDIGGRRYELQQFHFHRPSEERIDGRHYDLSVHLVHKDSSGQLAVVGVLMGKGGTHAVLQTVWNNLPLEKHQEQRARVLLDPTQLLPPDRRYFTYMGSLTTPPCSEGVRWVVMRQAVAAAPEQIDIFSRLYPMNARPVQNASGRRILQSN